MSCNIDSAKKMDGISVKWRKCSQEKSRGCSVWRWGDSFTNTEKNQNGNSMEPERTYMLYYTGERNQWLSMQQS